MGTASRDRDRVSSRAALLTALRPTWLLERGQPQSCPCPGCASAAWHIAWGRTAPSNWGTGTAPVPWGWCWCIVVPAGTGRHSNASAERRAAIRQWVWKLCVVMALTHRQPSCTSPCATPPPAPTKALHCPHRHPHGTSWVSQFPSSPPWHLLGVPNPYHHLHGTF